MKLTGQLKKKYKESSYGLTMQFMFQWTAYQQFAKVGPSEKLSDVKTILFLFELFRVIEYMASTINIDCS